MIARGVFTSVADLARELRKYIRAYAKTARPFRTPTSAEEFLVTDSLAQLTSRILSSQTGMHASVRSRRERDDICSNAKLHPDPSALLVQTAISLTNRPAGVWVTSSMPDGCNSPAINLMLDELLDTHKRV